MSVSSFVAIRNTVIQIPERSKMVTGVSRVCKFNLSEQSGFVLTDYSSDDPGVNMKACFFTGSTTTLRMHAAR
jgi:hypothetical protein